MRIVGALIWTLVLGAGLAGLALQPVAPGQQGRRGQQTLGPGLWFQVPRLWPIAMQPIDPPALSPSTAAPSPEEVSRQALRLQAEAVRIHDSLQQGKQSARQAAETTRKTIAAEEAAAERDRAALRAEAAAEGSRLLAEAEADAARLLGEAEAGHARAVAEAELALALAEAERDKRFAAALTGEGGRYHAAIEAARHFELGDLHLETQDPEFLKKFGSMAAWRRFFLGD